MKNLDEEFDKKIEEEALFLLKASKGYLQALKVAAKELKLDAFLQAIQQLHRSIGEVMGLTKYMQAKKERFEEIFNKVMTETQQILMEAFTVIEEFRRKFVEKCNRKD